MEAANGRIVDVDIAEESTRMAKYNAAGSGLGVHARPSQLVHRYRADANSLNKTPQKVIQSSNNNFRTGLAASVEAIDMEV